MLPRDVSCTHTIPMGNGRETLHMRADQTRNHLGLSLAKLRELGGDVSHRAVVLAELATGRDRRRAGSVTLGGQGAGERRGPSERIVTCVSHRRLTALFQLGDLRGGEGGDSLGAALSGYPA